MEFDREIVINRPPSAVYEMLADVQRFAVGPGSPVLEMEKTPPGPTAVGTTWREVIELAPHVRMTVWSRVTATDPGRTLAIAFRGPGMRGRLRYTIEPNDGGSVLRQRETLRTVGLLRPLEPIVSRMLTPRLIDRMRDVRDEVERSSGPIETFDSLG